ncbi:MAG TPA: hypothetical protein VK401_00435 [Propionibacteriaceae bacterium]|jgi:hypothetical protein|nr:hypothetical protein [Propionibacteriaceae bacterium]
MPVASLNPSDRVRGRLRTVLAALIGLATLVAVMLADLNNDVAARPAPDEIGAAALPDRTSVAATTVVARKPSALTTGVPAGTSLRVHRGDLVITKADTRIDRLDIHGFVVVKAPRVKITRSIVRGGKSPRTAMGLVTNYGQPGLVIEDSLLKPAYPSVYVDGIKGWNFTARRVHVVGNVDSIKIHGDNVWVEKSLLENTTRFTSDPYQGGGATHNDNIQVMKGRNITIWMNTIRGAQNFAILGSANIGSTPNLVIRGNWLDGGHCTVKLQSLRSYRLKVQLAHNRFGPNRRIAYCPVQAEPQVTLSAWNNLYERNRRPIAIYRGR